MKTSVNAKEFKKVIDSALAVAAKGLRGSLDKIEFNWSDAVHLRVLATNINEYYDYTFNECVTCAPDSTMRSVQIDNMTVKKLCNFSGDKLDIEIDENKRTFIIGNNKRKMSAAFDNQENNANFEVNADPADFTSVLTMEYDAFTKTIKGLGMFTSNNNSKPILTGFNFDCHNKRIVTCDGYKAAFRKLDKYEMPADIADVTISGVIAEAAKSFFVKGETVRVLVSKKYAKFISGNLVYHCRLLEGEYPNVYRNIPKDAVCDFEIETDEILGVCKDYKKLISDKSRTYCTLYNNNDGRFYMGISTLDIKSCTEISTTKTTKIPMRAGYNIHYMESCFGVFKGDTVLCSYRSERSPLVLENDEYISLLLPVNVSGIENVINSYNELIA